MTQRKGNPISFRISDELNARFERCIEKNLQTKTAVVKHLIERWVEEEEKKDQK